MKKKTFKLLSDYRTFLMGIAIISIIIFHFTEDCRSYNYMYNLPIKAYYQYISSVGVDIFLILSGLGLYYSMKKNNNVNQFYKKRYIRILIPYLLVAIPSLIQYCIVNNEGTLYFFKELTFINVFLLGSRKYWFILFICICYFIFPVLYNYINKSKRKDEVITKILLLTLLTTVFNELLKVGNPVFYSHISLMIVRFFPFFIGILFGYFSYKKEQINKAHIVSMIICLFLILLASSKSDVLRTYSKCISFLSFCFLFIIILSKIDKNKIVIIIRKIIEWFGKYSLEIYLIHVSVRRIFSSYSLYPCHIKYFILYLTISLLLVPVVNRLSKLITNLLNKSK